MQAYEHFGDYLRNPAFAAFHALSIKAFSLFQEHSVEANLSRPRNDLIRRMMYVAEAMSVSLRMSSSWALTHPAFSLCRDRYEQCVRFSWLARQTDSREWYRYIADVYFTHHRLKNALDHAGIELGVELDDGGLGELTPKARKKFALWSKAIGFEA